MFGSQGYFGTQSYQPVSQEMTSIAPPMSKYPQKSFTKSSTPQTPQTGVVGTGDYQSHVGTTTSLRYGGLPKVLELAQHIPDISSLMTKAEWVFWTDNKDGLVVSVVLVHESPNAPGDPITGVGTSLIARYAMTDSKYGNGKKSFKTLLNSVQDWLVETKAPMPLSVMVTINNTEALDLYKSLGFHSAWDHKPRKDPTGNGGLVYLLLWDPESDTRKTNKDKSKLADLCKCGGGGCQGLGMCLSSCCQLFGLLLQC